MKHKHYDLIIKWAEGAEIEVFMSAADNWVPIKEPSWDPNSTYRVKPRPEYPKSTLSYNDLCKVVNAASEVPGNEGIQTKIARLAANEAIVCFIQSGEMDKYIEKNPKR